MKRVANGEPLRSKKCRLRAAFFIGFDPPTCREGFRENGEVLPEISWLTGEQGRQRAKRALEGVGGDPFQRANVNERGRGFILSRGAT